MNRFVSVLLVVALSAAAVSAEPPRFRQQFRSRFFQRQEVEPTTEAAEETTTDANDAPYPPASGPYPPSGWKPSGRLLALPARQTATQPPAAYAPPQEPNYAYGPPAEENPETTTQEAETETETEETSTEDQQKSAKLEVESVEPINTSEVEPQVQPQQQPGFYFVQLAPPQLQPLIYVTPNGVVSAKLQAAPVASTAGQLLYSSPVFLPNIAAPVNNDW